MSGVTPLLCWLGGVLTWHVLRLCSRWHVLLLRAECTCMHCGTCMVALRRCQLHCGMAPGITHLV